MTWTDSTNAGYDAAGTTQGRYLGRVKERAEGSEDLVKMFGLRGILKSSVVAARTARCSFEYSNLHSRGRSRLLLLFGRGSLVASRGL